MLKQLAVIDIGSNTVRLQISEVLERKRYSVILEEKDTIRLGEEVFKKGFFGPDSFEKARLTMLKFKQIVQQKNIEHIRAVATAGFREAANQQMMLDYLRKETGINIEVISGEEEARMIAMGVLANFDLAGRTALIIDIGGGSAEIITANSKDITDIQSMSLGCTRLTRYFLKNLPVKAHQLEMLENHIDNVLEEIEPNTVLHPVDIIIGTGGSLNNITEIIYKDKKESLNAPAREVSLEQVRKLNEELYKKDEKERLQMPGLDKKRVDIILAAGKVIERVMELYGINSFISLSKGLRDGLTLDTINNLGIHFPYQFDNEVVKEHRVWELGHKYRFDEQHAYNVRDLCRVFFKKLQKPLGFKSKWLEYLDAAALLHDIGYYISFEKHHKHSQYLVENSEFVGFDELEVRIIANLVRYHRKSPPKTSHTLFNELPPAAQEIVMKMASLLRLADALDRSHQEKVHEVDISLSSKELVISIAQPASQLLIEMEGLEHKKDMFEKVFDRSVKLVMLP